jgi:Cysteine-rich CPCC
MPFTNQVNPELYPCPCCGYRTLPQEAGGTYALCPICFWEDDGVQLDDPDYEGGANVVFAKAGSEKLHGIRRLRKAVRKECQRAD